MWKARVLSNKVCLANLIRHLSYMETSWSSAVMLVMMGMAGLSSYLWKMMCCWKLVARAAQCWSCQTPTTTFVFTGQQLGLAKTSWRSNQWYSPWLMLAAIPTLWWGLRSLMYLYRKHHKINSLRWLLLETTSSTNLKRVKTSWPPSLATLLRNMYMVVTLIATVSPVRLMLRSLAALRVKSATHVTG